MEWRDEGIVIATRRHGESGLIVDLLTRDHGRHAGLVRGGQSPRQRPLYETGNQLLVTWKARLEEHLGLLAAEPVRSRAAAFLDDPLRLACLAAAAALAEAALPERAPSPAAYAGLKTLLDALERNEGWGAAAVEWEVILLAELGFGLDLTRCAATGGTQDLVYVSPKSGQAVSAAAGEPYRRRLLALPRFLVVDAPATAEDVLAGLALAEFFLEQRFFVPHARKMPPARSRFVDALRQSVTISRG